jgi:hypothetical protein
MLLLIPLPKTRVYGLNKKQIQEYPPKGVFISMKRQSLAYAANRSHIHGTDPV